MIYVKYNKVTGKEELQHYMPFDEQNGLQKTKEELEQEGLLVESIPEPLLQVGKQAVLYVNLSNRSLYYQYIDLPIEPQHLVEKLEQLEQEKNILQLALAESIEKQEIDKLNNQIALAELVETLTIKGVL